MSKLLTSSKIVLENEILPLRNMLPSAIYGKWDDSNPKNPVMNTIFATNSYFSKEWSPFGLSPFRREIRSLSSKNFSNYVLRE